MTSVYHSTQRYCSAVWIMAGWILLGICVLAPRPAAAQEAPPASVPQAQSQYALQQQYSRLTQELELLDQQIRLVAQTGTNLSKAKNDIAALIFDEKSASSALDDLKHRVQLSNGKPSESELYRSRGILSRILNQPLSPLYAAIQNIRPAGDNRSEPLQPLMSQFEQVQFEKDKDDKLSELFVGSPDPAVLKDITAANLRGAFDALKQRSIQVVDALIGKAGEIRADLVKKQDSKKEELKKLDNQLNQLAEQRAIVDQRLIYSVYAMIGSLVVLFFLVRFFTKEIQHAIIDNRVLVEVVAMAFLLLTIIILATGSKLEPQALGTLLGTIAGYIFGRRIESTPASPKTPPHGKPSQEIAS